MSVSTLPEQHAVLHGIRWKTYERLLEELEGHRVRLTYDRGLEIMSPSRPHERARHRLRRMLEAMTEELDVPIEGGGSTTWRRQDLEKGLEADECYWIRNEPAVRGRDELDLRVDPPPDLALEVAVSTSALDRMGIYGALGVPEVWRIRDGRIRVHLRQPDGRYREAPRSASFPWLPVEVLEEWLAKAHPQGETAFIRAFRVWVRENLSAR